MILLFQISLFHRYFAGGVFAPCAVVPDDATLGFLRRYCLTVRNAGGRIEVYCDSAKVPLALLGYLNERLAGAPLQFLLMFNETRFTQITDLPLDYVGQISLSSSTARTAHDDTARQPRREMVAVLGPRARNRDGVIGVVAVHLADCIAAGGQDIVYSVDFPARVLHWLYYLINRSQGRLRSPAICNQQGMRFDPPVQVTLDNGESALRFSSGGMQFPLQQEANTSFDLIDSLHTSLDPAGQADEHCLIRGLPTPDGNNLKLKQVENSPYAFGEMYVYL